MKWTQKEKDKIRALYEEWEQEMAAAEGHELMAEEISGRLREFGIEAFEPPRWVRCDASSRR